MACECRMFQLLQRVCLREWANTNSPDPHTANPTPRTVTVTTAGRWCLQPSQLSRGTIEMAVLCEHQLVVFLRV